MCDFHIFHHQVFFKAQPTLNLYKLGLQISCVWTYDEWPQLKVPLLQKSRSLAKNQQENQANLVDKSIFTHEAGALSKPGLLKEYLCVQTPIPSPCLLFRREHAHMAQCKVPVCLQLSWETWHDVRPLVSFWAWTAFLLHFTWQGEHLAKPSPSSAHAGWFHSEAAITQTGMWSGHVSDTFISFTSRRFSNE